MTENNHGLSRYIPEEIKLKIRQNSLFGCVKCCSSIFEYEHIDPEFVDALVHDPACMTLLCPTCHQNVTSGRLSKATVKKCQENPCPGQTGCSRDIFDIGATMPFIQIGGKRLVDCPVPLWVDNEPLFKIQAGEEAGAPFRLSADFYNETGQKILSIIENEWIVYVHNTWDVNVVGKNIKIRDGKGKTALEIEASPPDGIIIKNINMRTKNMVFSGDSNELRAKVVGGDFIDITDKINNKNGIDSKYFKDANKKQNRDRSNGLSL